MLFPLEYKRYLKEVLHVLTKAFSEYFALSVSEKWLARPTSITMEQHIKMKIMFNFYTFHIRLFDKKFHPEKLNLILSTIVIKFLQRRFEFTQIMKVIQNTILWHKLREEE